MVSAVKTVKRDGWLVSAEKTTRKYGWQPDVPDHRDHRYVSKRSPIPLPPKVDRFGHGNRIENQGNLGSCTGNSVTSAVEIALNLPHQLSRLMAYYGGRKLEGNTRKDAGCMIRSVIKGIRTDGVCKETLYPYNIDNFKKAPTRKARKDALDLPSLIYKRLKTLGEVKNALAQGIAVVFGFASPDYFSGAEVEKTGWCRMPLDTDKWTGGHAVVAVGYDDTAEKPFIWVRNSWGPKWGINGYFQMDQEWFRDPRSLVDDMWVLMPASFNF